MGVSDDLVDVQLKPQKYSQSSAFFPSLGITLQQVKAVAGFLRSISITTLALRESCCFSF